MTHSIDTLFKTLFSNFLNINNDVLAVIVSDRDGLIIAGEKVKSIDMELVSVLTAVVNPILERIRDEFAFKKFGTASFDTNQYRLLFVSIDENNTLSIVLDSMASIDKVAPYAYFLAEKAAQILNYEYGDTIQLAIPNFEYEIEEAERLKNQIYQMRLDSGGKYRFKFIIVGNHEVGKTSIVRRFVEKKFSMDYRATIGLNILSHKFNFIGNEINLSLWDIGAQQYFRRFRKTYYSGAQAAFIVFDLTNRESFENIINWFNELNTFLGKSDLPIVIVGNKSDLKEQRVISYEEGVAIASKLNEEGVTNISYIETSALTGENIEDAFNLIAYHYILKSKEYEENELKKDILEEINKILEKKGKLILVFYTPTPYWSPALQIFSEIKDLGNYRVLKDENNAKIYEYDNGIIIKNYLYDIMDVDNADGIFCIFDARKMEKIDPKWKEIVIEMIEKIKENKVILIGIRVSEQADWSKIMEDFDLNEQLEKKLVSLLIFKIGTEYRLEVFDQLKVMLSSIRNI
ncbi:MAG: GTP-binding protein [Promethearchaeota archaeon]